MLVSWRWASARRFAPGHDKRQQRGWRRLLHPPRLPDTQAKSHVGFGPGNKLHKSGAVVFQGRASRAAQRRAAGRKSSPSLAGHWQSRLKFLLLAPFCPSLWTHGKPLSSGLSVQHLSPVLPRLKRLGNN